MENGEPQFKNEPLGHVAADSRIQLTVLGNLKQKGAHLYFIVTALLLGVRWQILILTGIKKHDPSKERLRLGLGSITLLESWGLIRTEFVGFDDASSWRGRIIAPNHPSMIDAILIMSRVMQTDCVINAKLLANPLTVGAARLCNFILNDSTLGMIKTCQTRLAEGANILIFPEGTRTRTLPLGRFYHSYALAAIRAGAPIQTVFIECDSNYFGSEFSFIKPARSKVPLLFKITAGKVFPTTRELSPRELSSEIESYFRENLTSNGIGVTRTKVVK
jgi:1-acyl-sn-glycerol-3-phosphate acyltransferase